MVAGLIGAALMSSWFLVLDALSGLPFRTPTVVGAAIFDGASVADISEASVKTVFAYSGLHVLAFLAVGWAVSWMFREFDDHPQFGVVYLLTFVLFEVTIFGLQVAMAPEILGLLGTGAVAVGNLLSCAGMFAFLLHRHPQSFVRLAEGWRADGRP